jgi:hypothetical protein
VGVSGYTLGGGLSPTLGRSYGYAADHVRSFEVVTADGVLRHVDAGSEPELFWAMRGGKGNFVVVTRLEFDLFPVARLYAGAIYYPGERMADVLRAWAAWLPGTPETMISSFAVQRMPVSPVVPESLRGAFLVAVRIAYNGTVVDGERMVAPLRAVAPAVQDTVRDMLYTEVASIHNEPVDPLPYYERGVSCGSSPRTRRKSCSNWWARAPRQIWRSLSCVRWAGRGTASRRCPTPCRPEPSVQPAGGRVRHAGRRGGAQEGRRRAARRHGPLAGRPAIREQPRARRGS